MKLSTLIILGVLGVIAFALLKPGKVERRDAEVAPATPAAASQPVPTVHVTSLAIVRGQVVEAVGDRVVVNCDFVAKISASAQARWRTMANAAGGGEALIAKAAQAEAEMATFGKLQAMNEDGQMVVAPSAPERRATGRVILQGLPVRQGGMVHVVAAPIAMDPSGLSIYTPRFKVMGGSWMWNDRRGLLERR